MATRIKKGDVVQIISGKYRSKIGKVLKVVRPDKIVVEGINIMKKATKANPSENVQGGIIEEPAPMYQSKAMLYCDKCHKGVRVSFERANRKVLRKCKKCGSILENR